MNKAVNIQAIVATNFHKDHGVSVPATITLSQLLRWLAFEFTPLPTAIEMQYTHFPFFSPAVMAGENHPLSVEIPAAQKKILSALKSGLLNAQGRMDDKSSEDITNWRNILKWPKKKDIANQEPEAIAASFWEEDLSIYWSKNNAYGPDYGYTDVCLMRTEIERVFDLAQDVREHDFGTAETNAKDTVYWISYSPDTQEILLNDLFLIGKPFVDSINERIFQYLYKNQGRKITDDELKEQATSGNFNKTLSDIVKELGFTGHLRDAFFSVKQDEILFKGTVSKSDMDRLGLKHLRISGYTSRKK